MRRILWMMLALAAFSAAGADAGSPGMNPAEAAARYNQAGESYRSGQFQTALDGYESILLSGVRNPDLYYNAANAAYRAGRMGKAVLYYERALRLAPSDADARTNLAFVNVRKQDRDPVEDNAVLVFLGRWYGRITVNAAALVSGWVFAAVMLLAIGVLFCEGWKRMTLAVAAGVMGVIFLGATGVFVQKVHHAAVTVEAVISVPEVHAYSGPGMDNTLIFTLHEGTKVVLERGQDGWILVRMKSGVGGWIEERALTKI